MDIDKPFRHSRKHNIEPQENIQENEKEDSRSDTSNSTLFSWEHKRTRDRQSQPAGDNSTIENIIAGLSKVGLQQKKKLERKKRRLIAAEMLNEKLSNTPCFIERGQEIWKGP